MQLKKNIYEKAYFGLAWTYLKIGSIDLSIRSFETIKDQASSNVVKVNALTQIGDAYQDVGRFDDAIEIYDQILADYPESLYTDYVQYRQGVALLKQNKITTATLSFQSLQSNFPNSKYLTDSKYYLAVAYFKLSNWVAAKEHISNFLNDSPINDQTLAEAHYILALSNFNLNDFHKAIGAFRGIIKNFPYQTAMVKNSELKYRQIVL